VQHKRHLLVGNQEHLDKHRLDKHHLDKRRLDKPHLDIHKPLQAIHLHNMAPPILVLHHLMQGHHKAELHILVLEHLVVHHAKVLVQPLAVHHTLVPRQARHPTLVLHPLVVLRTILEGSILGHLEQVAIHLPHHQHGNLTYHIRKNVRE
jgi:hypothetical protein